MQMNQQLFVTDFDGTLLKDNKTVSWKDIDTFKRLKERNVLIAVATGRSFHLFQKALSAMEDAVGKFDLPVDYVIFSTGAGIMDLTSNSLIYKRVIDHLAVKKITTYFDSCRIDYMVHKAIPDTNTFFYKSFNNHNEDFTARLGLYKQFAKPFPAYFKDFGHATQVLGIIPHTEASYTADVIQEKLSDFSVIQATSPLDHKSSWIEVFHKDVSKSQAVSWLSHRLGIMNKNITSIGNDYNDEDLLLWSGHAYVVSNAPDYLKSRFHTVSSNNNSGVTDATIRSGLLQG